MGIQKKITSITLLFMLIFTLFSNIAFRHFFRVYLMQQETEQIYSLERSISTFLQERKTKYQGNAGDWSHWDDTYYYIAGSNPDYIESNFTVDVYMNLDISFVILLDTDKRVRYQQYFNMDSQDFTSFPDEFFENFNRHIVDLADTRNITGIFEAGGNFYFLATSAITDNFKVRESIGTFVLGREIDENMISRMENMSGSRISFSILDDIDDYSSDSESIFPDHSVKDYRVMFDDSKDMLFIKLIYGGISDNDSGILISVMKERELLLTGMRQMDSFLMVYASVMLSISLLVFFLLHIFISKPFGKLIREVVSLDPARNNLKKLILSGSDEFSVLRKSINRLLNRIELEQSKVLENKEKLYATLVSVGDGVIAADRYARIEFLNPTAQQLTGWNQDAAYGRSFDEVFYVVNEFTGEKAESPVQKVFETEEAVELANNTVLIAKDGFRRSIEDVAAPIRDKDGNIIGAVLVFRDCSDRKIKQKQIMYLSYHDQLTGLYNRRFFEEELRRLDTRRNLPLSLIMGDVNGLKTINDAFGHDNGDRLLQIVAEILKAECRTDDIIALMGGDEFMILLPKTDSAAVEGLAQRLKNKIEQVRIMGINISISFGWETKTDESQSIEELTKNAENYMYQKKIYYTSSRRSEVIKSILHTLHLKSHRENAHSQRVSVICEAIGRAYSLSEDEIQELKTAGELHDIGKIAIDEAILNKADRLNEDEWAQIRRHPETGYRLLGTSGSNYNIAEYIFAHHEKWDGTGYPKGLAGEAIHWKARVIAIADAFDAMTCDRPYRKAMTVAEASDEIMKNAGTQFDPDIARVFVEQILPRT